jgi:hypothetical protein
MDTIIRSEPDSRITQSRNKGKLTGAKPPLRPKHVWAVRTAPTVGTHACNISQSFEESSVMKCREIRCQPRR